MSPDQCAAFRAFFAKYGKDKALLSCCIPPQVECSSFQVFAAYVELIAANGKYQIHIAAEAISRIVVVSKHQLSF